MQRETERAATHVARLGEDPNYVAAQTRKLAAEIERDRKSELRRISTDQRLADKKQREEDRGLNKRSREAQQEYDSRPENKAQQRRQNERDRALENDEYKKQYGGDDEDVQKITYRALWAARSLSRHISGLAGGLIGVFVELMYDLQKREAEAKKGDRNAQLLKEARDQRAGLMPSGGAPLASTLQSPLFQSQTSLPQVQTSVQPPFQSTAQTAASTTSPTFAAPPVSQPVPQPAFQPVAQVVQAAAAAATATTQTIQSTTSASPATVTVDDSDDTEVRRKNSDRSKRGQQTRRDTTDRLYKYINDQRRAGAERNPGLEYVPIQEELAELKKERRRDKYRKDKARDQARKNRPLGQVEEEPPPIAWNPDDEATPRYAGGGELLPASLAALSAMPTAPPDWRPEYMDIPPDQALRHVKDRAIESGDRDVLDISRRAEAVAQYVNDYSQAPRQVYNRSLQQAYDVNEDMSFDEYADARAEARRQSDASVPVHKELRGVGYGHDLPMADFTDAETEPTRMAGGGELPRFASGSGKPWWRKIFGAGQKEQSTTGQGEQSAEAAQIAGPNEIIHKESSQQDRFKPPSPIKFDPETWRKNNQLRDLLRGALTQAGYHAKDAVSIASDEDVLRVWGMNAPHSSPAEALANLRKSGVLEYGPYDAPYFTREFDKYKQQQEDTSVASEAASLEEITGETSILGAPPPPPPGVRLTKKGEIITARKGKKLPQQETEPPANKDKPLPLTRKRPKPFFGAGQEDTSEDLPELPPEIFSQGGRLPHCVSGGELPYENFSSGVLSTDEIKSLNVDYLLGSQSINKDLRDGKELGAKRKKTVDLIDSAIEKSHVNKNTRLYRGVNFQEKQNLLNTPIGEDITKDDYTSASVSEDVAKTFTDYRSPMVMAIDVPVGSRAMPMSEMYKNTPDLAYEKEVLLPRGSKYRLTEIDRKAGIAYVELVSPDPQNKPAIPHLAVGGSLATNAPESYAAWLHQRWTNDKLSSEKLSKSEREELGTYLGDSSYVNDALRKGVDPKRVSTDLMDSAIKKSRTRENIKLYRGVKGEEKQNILNAGIGKTITKSDYTSTSASDSAARGFAGDVDPMLMAIDVPSGSHAMSMSGMYGEYPRFDYEQEVLLQRGNKYHIKHIDPHSGMVHVDLLPREDSHPPALASGGRTAPAAIVGDLPGQSLASIKSDPHTEVILGNQVIPHHEAARHGLFDGKLPRHAEGTKPGIADIVGTDSLPFSNAQMAMNKLFAKLTGEIEELTEQIEDKAGLAKQIVEETAPKKAEVEVEQLILPLEQYHRDLQAKYEAEVKSKDSGFIGQFAQDYKNRNQAKENRAAGAPDWGRIGPPKPPDLVTAEDVVTTSKYSLGMRRGSRDGSNVIDFNGGGGSGGGSGGGVGGGGQGGAGQGGGIFGAASDISAKMPLIGAILKAKKMVEDTVLGTTKAAIGGASGIANWSASADADPSKPIGAFGDAASKAGESLAKVDLISGTLTMAFGEGVKSVSGFMQALDQTTKRYGEVTPMVAQQEAMGEVRQVLGDLRRGQEVGPELVRYMQTQQDMQQKFEDIKIKILNQLLAVVNPILKIMDQILPTGEAVSSTIATLLTPLAAIAEAAAALVGIQKDDRMPDIQDPADIMLSQGNDTVGTERSVGIR